MKSISALERQTGVGATIVVESTDVVAEVVRPLEWSANI